LALYAAHEPGIRTRIVSPFSAPLRSGVPHLVLNKHMGDAQ
jgi:hypothetical protein